MSVKKRMERRKLERMSEFGYRSIDVTFKVVYFLFP